MAATKSTATKADGSGTTPGAPLRLVTPRASPMACRRNHSYNDLYLRVNHVHQGVVMSLQEHPAVDALAKVLAQAAVGGDASSIEVESLTGHHYGADGELGYLVSLRGSSPYFVGVGGRVQQVEIICRPPVDTDVEVEFKKSGGVAGIRQEIKLSEHDGYLTQEDAAALRNWLSEVDFFDIMEDCSGPTVYDGFNHSDTASHERRRRTITAEQGRGNATIARLGPLLIWLKSRLPDPQPRMSMN